MAYNNDYCGIYKIENLVNGKVYIGQSRHIRQRWAEHKKVLRRDCHKNTFLQRAWDKYGEDNFSFEVLELCDINDLNNCEIKYINQYDSFNSDKGYNLTSGGDSKKEIANSTRQKLSENILGKNHPNRKEVICLETLFVYDTIKYAANSVGVDYSMITRCCCGEICEVAGKHWMFYEDYLDAKAEDVCKMMDQHMPGKEKKIIYLNTDEIFNSIKEASEKTNINANSISQCCLHNRKSAGKDESGNPRVFMYFDEYMKQNGQTIDDYVVHLAHRY